MKMIKTYEGFFDFFKKKEKKPPVQLDEVMECLYDLTDDHRIKNVLNGDRFDGIFVDDRYVFKRKSSMGLGDDDVRAFRDKAIGLNFRVSSDHSSNDISFRMIYNPSEISDSEVNELLLDCKSKLEIYGCKLSFFIGWGRDEGSTDDREWTDFMRMIDKTINKSGHFATSRSRNITIKITSSTGFEKLDKLR